MSLGAVIQLAAVLASADVDTVTRPEIDSTQCEHSQHRAFLRDLKAGVPIETALDYLLAHGARYFIYSKDDQGLSLDAIKEGDYEALMPITVLTLSAHPWSEESEVLGLVFGDERELTARGCKTI